MKVAHSNKDYVSFKDLVSMATALEKEGKWEDAASLWSKALKQMPLLPKPYDRFMIIYRKQGNYKRELEMIDLAIATFEKHYRQHQKEYNKRVLALSKALSRSTGLTDKKGNQVFQSGELSKWQRRKALSA